MTLALLPHAHQQTAKCWGTSCSRMTTTTPGLGSSSAGILLCITRSATVSEQGHWHDMVINLALWRWLTCAGRLTGRLPERCVRAGPAHLRLAAAVGAGGVADGPPRRPRGGPGRPRGHGLRHMRVRAAGQHRNHDRRLWCARSTCPCNVQMQMQMQNSRCRPQDPLSQ